MTHEELMKRAFALAEQCRPIDPKNTPKLGVIIAKDDVPIGQAHRGTGDKKIKEEDAHAEKLAIASVADKTQIRGATVYTTLEPCTWHVRRTTSESCTDLLIREAVGKVVIGMLDPNQGVCGE